MVGSSLRRTNVVRVCGYAVMGIAIVAIAGAGCGSKSGPTQPPPPTTTTTAPTTTTVASTTTTTTTTVPGTTSTTTTSIAVLDAFISVNNTPCVAPNAGQVSCTFAGSATGGRTPYTFSWVFTNPANNQTVNVSGANARPELGCGFSSGVATFSVRAVLTVTDASGTRETEDRNQQMTRTGCGI